MQRWLIGGGIALGAILLAVFLVPSVDTGDQVDSQRRSQGEVKLVHPKKAEVSTRSQIEERRAVMDKQRRERAAISRPKHAYMGKSARHRELLATHDLTVSVAQRPWNALDRALDDVETKDARVFQKRLKEMEKMVSAGFEGVKSFEKSYKVQTQFIDEIRRSDLNESPAIAEALDALDAEVKRALAIGSKL